MASLRSPFQGTWNIIRFNWHFYALSILAIIILLVLGILFFPNYLFYVKLLSFAIILVNLISLTISYLVYDGSNLYHFDWLKANDSSSNQHILNINAGFDESSTLLQAKFENSKLSVLDFYNPNQHTEISIQRARKVYPPFPGTINVETKQLPFEDQSIDQVFLFLSAHEIRDEKERIVFFKELKRILKSQGQIQVTEHLRDFPNFAAYNIGFFHFHSKASWLKTFHNAKLQLSDEIKITPFISNFTLTKA